MKSLLIILIFLSTYDNISGTWINKENNHELTFNQKNRDADIKWKFNSNYTGPKILIGKGVVDIIDGIGDIVAGFELFPIYIDGGTCKTTNIILSTKAALYENCLYTTQCYVTFSANCNGTIRKIKTPCHGRWE